MIEFWEEWGALAYGAAVLWAFFEGETFVLAAAAIGAATGLIDPWLLMLSVWAGSFAGDQTWFTLGRRFGPSLLDRFPATRPRVAAAGALLERHGTLFILSFRFLYGIRNVAAAVCGLAGMPWSRFATLNFIGAGAWAGSFVAAGWFVGGLLGVENLFYLIAAAGLLALLAFIWRHYRRRRLARAVP
ncbi:MAG: DedA family protein [Acetobacteraceae bacterium]|nr:DedA family protein [Acetobacteraceae bacterium]